MHRLCQNLASFLRPARRRCFHLSFAMPLTSQSLIMSLRQSLSPKLQCSAMYALEFCHVSSNGLLWLTDAGMEAIPLYNLRRFRLEMLRHGGADVREAVIGRSTGCEDVPDVAVCCVTTGPQEDCPAIIGIVDVIGSEVEGCSFDIEEVKRTKSA